MSNKKKTPVKTTCNQRPQVTRKKGSGITRNKPRIRGTLQSDVTNPEPNPINIKPELTAEDLAKAMKGSGKKTSADILSDMVNNNGNIHMKAVVNSPIAYTIMHVKSRAYNRDSYPKSGLVFQEIAELQEQFAVSGKKDNRAKMVIKAIESVMAQEYEIAKSQARRMMGQK